MTTTGEKSRKGAGAAKCARCEAREAYEKAKATASKAYRKATVPAWEACLKAVEEKEHTCRGA